MTNLEDVFKLNGVPTVTFVRPKEYSRLLVGLRTPGRGVIVEGPSGIGKTTAVTKVLQELKKEQQTVQQLSARRAADLEYIEILPEINAAGMVLIDDFHRLSPALQESIANYLKLLADNGSTDTKLILVGINEANTRLIEFAPDLQARLEVIKLENNSEDKLRELISLGEKELNVEIGAKEEIIEAAKGSFYLAQMLCHEICVQADLLVSASEHRMLPVSVELAKTKLYTRLTPRFYQDTKTFVRGVKFQSTGRAPYFEVLNWLAESTEWSINLRRSLQERPASKGSVGQIMDKGFLDTFITERFSALMHYDRESTVLSVEDPQFLFFLREIIWPELKADAGFQEIERKHMYDFALSFAGEQRELVEAVAEEIRSRELAVFYDKFEQSRILAEDVEEYLRPVYQAQARFVVVFLSEDYPQRIWTVFESQQFRDRFKKGEVIAAMMPGYTPDVFSEAARRGFIRVEDQPVSTEAKRITDLLEGKLAAGPTSTSST